MSKRTGDGRLQEREEEHAAGGGAGDGDGAAAHGAGGGGGRRVPVGRPGRGGGDAQPERDQQVRGGHEEAVGALVQLRPRAPGHSAEHVEGPGGQRARCAGRASQARQGLLLQLHFVQFTCIHTDIVYMHTSLLQI